MEPMRSLVVFGFIVRYNLNLIAILFFGGVLLRRNLLVIVIDSHQGNFRDLRAIASFVFLYS